MTKTLYDPEVEKRGLEKGKKEGKIEVAQNLLTLGLSIDQIIKATGLTKEQIQELVK